LAKALRTPDLTPEGSLTRSFGEGAEFQTGWKAAVAVTMPSGFSACAVRAIASASAEPASRV